MSGPYSPTRIGVSPGYTPAHGIGNIGLMWPSGASFTCDVRRPSSRLTIGMLDQNVGVSIRSAPQRRHSLANTGQAIRGCAAIMCEPCSMMGTLMAGSSASCRSTAEARRVADQQAVGAQLHRAGGLVEHALAARR